MAVGDATTTSAGEAVARAAWVRKRCGWCPVKSKAMRLRGSGGVRDVDEGSQAAGGARAVRGAEQELRCTGIGVVHDVGAQPRGRVYAGDASAAGACE